MGIRSVAMTAIALGGCGRIAFDSVPTATCASRGELATSWQAASPDWLLLGAAEQNNQLVIALAANAPNNYGGAYSQCTIDLTGHAIYVEIVTSPAQVLGAQQTIYMSTDASGDRGVGWIIEAGALYAIQPGNGEFAMVAFDAIAQRFLQLRESAGTVFWEASPDALTWNLIATLPTPLPVTALDLKLQGGTYLSIAAPGNAVFGSVVAP